MAKRGKPITKKTGTQMVRIKKDVVDTIKEKKSPGQSIGGHIQQLTDEKYGYSNPDLSSNT